MLRLQAFGPDIVEFVNLMTLRQGTISDTTFSPTTEVPDLFAFVSASLVVTLAVLMSWRRSLLFVSLALPHDCYIGAQGGHLHDYFARRGPRPKPHFSRMAGTAEWQTLSPHRRCAFRLLFTASQRGLSSFRSGDSQLLKSSSEAHGRFWQKSSLEAHDHFWQIQDFIPLCCTEWICCKLSPLLSLWLLGIPLGRFAFSGRAAKRLEGGPFLVAVARRRMARRR